MDVEDHGRGIGRRGRQVDRRAQVPDVHGPNDLDDIRGGLVHFPDQQRRRQIDRPARSRGGQSDPGDDVPGADHRNHRKHQDTLAEPHQSLRPRGDCDKARDRRGKQQEGAERCPDRRTDDGIKAAGWLKKGAGDQAEDDGADHAGKCGQKHQEKAHGAPAMAR